MDWDGLACSGSRMVANIIMQENRKQAELASGLFLIFLTIKNRLRHFFLGGRDVSGEEAETLRRGGGMNGVGESETLRRGQ